MFLPMMMKSPCRIAGAATKNGPAREGGVSALVCFALQRARAKGGESACAGGASVYAHTTSNVKSSAPTAFAVQPSSAYAVGVSAPSSASFVTMPEAGTT